MAPRRHSRAGNTRRDAALDAMRAFGFDDSLIKKTLNELLKVYGKDGWAFIETDCYKVLTDAILDTIEQKQLEQDHGNLIENQPQQNDDNLIEIQPDRDNFTEVLPDLLITDHPDIDESQDQDEITPQIDESEVVCGDRAQEVTEQVLQAEVQFAVKKCSERQAINPMCETLAADVSDNQGADKPRRKPCFGWISDEEDDDYVILKPSKQ